MKNVIPVILIFLYFLLTILMGKETVLTSGIVSDGNQPVAGARVRVQGENQFVLSDSLGQFTLNTAADFGQFINISAGKEGWYNSGRSVLSGDTNVVIILSALPPGDHPFYEFKSPSDCQTCHNTLHDQWQQSKHANAATNPMLLQMYRGTDVNGNSGIAPGFKLDFPEKGGDCADCHMPAAALFNPGNTDLNLAHLIGGVAVNGVFCDFCHKVREVEIDYDTGVNGSLFLQRPPDNAGQDINIGPFDDVTTPWMGGTYAEVFTKSAFCSGCHQYSNLNDVIVDDTYDTWAVSDYAAQGIQCQDCHQKPWADSVFVSGIGFADAVKRDPARIYNHLFRGASPELHNAAAKMTVKTEIFGDTLLIRAMIHNQNAGHKLPTGVSFRNILLTLTVNQNEQRLTQLSGDTIPHFGGVGNPETGNYAGLPGKGFALVTRDGNTGEWPVPNWLTTEIFYDSRIPPHRTDTTEYRFLLDQPGEISIDAKLLYRAVYKPMADAKGWDMREYVMADSFFTLPITGITKRDPLPDVFVLQQNYPNPFNAETLFKFTLSRPDFVTLTIYNIGGERVKTLISEILSEGSYQYRWNAGGMVSGVYFYQLQSGRFSQTRKLLLIR